MLFKAKAGLRSPSEQPSDDGARSLRGERVPRSASFFWKVLMIRSRAQGICASYVPSYEGEEVGPERTSRRRSNNNFIDTIPKGGSQHETATPALVAVR
jgi:hypothetical protein